MLKNIAVIYPNIRIRNKLRRFTKKFNFNKRKIKEWITIYLTILKN